MPETTDIQIDWFSDQTEILLNPRSNKNKIAEALNYLPTTGDLVAHLWFSTSGSTGEGDRTKYVALSKQAFLASAAAVNRHLNISTNDVWINPLPLFHVGGLAIHARAFLSKSLVISYQEPWDPIRYKNTLEEHKGTLSSLVPTQVYDLVSAKLFAPRSHRAIFVGGGALSESLYEKAWALGWKLLPTYGMTEASSQIATALPDVNPDPTLILLPHLNVKVNLEGFLCLQGNSLLTCYGYVSSSGVCIIDPKIDGWLTTQDKGQVNGCDLIIFGRGDDCVKINGENVELLRLESIIETLKLKLDFQEDVALVALPDKRSGHTLHLVTTSFCKVTNEQLVSTFHAAVMPFEKIHKIHRVEKIPRSPLNKILRSSLKSLIAPGS